VTIIAPGSGSPVGDPFEGPTAQVEERGTSLWRGAFTRLRRDPFAIVGALIVLAFVAVMARAEKPKALNLEGAKEIARKAEAYGKKKSWKLSIAFLVISWSRPTSEICSYWLRPTR